MKLSVLNQIWKAKTVDETHALFEEWANDYESDMADVGYVTPDRIARISATLVDDLTAPVLDYGCGTGLSCQSMLKMGFTTLDGTDISQKMLNYANSKSIYRRVIHTEPASMGAINGREYGLIIAAGVISRGAAGPETLDFLIENMGSGAILVFSYNQTTLDDPVYMDNLAAVKQSGVVEIVAEEHGAHMTAKEVNSTIYALTKI
ncbi:MAG: methyltransferase domain-containing protein [Paracoccaceae bacterium]|nr:methyltransferase domain-containing protein [Paracoccaceae bacterium]